MFAGNSPNRPNGPGLMLTRSPIPLTLIHADGIRSMITLLVRFIDELTNVFNAPVPSCERNEVSLRFCVEAVTIQFSVLSASNLVKLGRIDPGLSKSRIRALTHASIIGH